jgi:segregation and condensation protein B
MHNGSEPGRDGMDGFLPAVGQGGMDASLPAGGLGGPARAEGRGAPGGDLGRSVVGGDPGRSEPCEDSGRSEPCEDPGRSEPGGDPGGPASADAESVPSLRACLEAIMLVADEPVSEVVIAQVLERPRAEVVAALRELAVSYAAEQRGFDLREVAGGWRFYTREECAPVVERFVSDGQEVRLTQAALETLAVVAYRQPVSRARVSAVRGVNCDGVMRTLVLRGLVAEVGTDPETGAILFGTTSYFLERLGLPNLDALPDLAPFLPDHVDDEPDGGHEPAES